MDRGAWWANSPWSYQDSDRTEGLNNNKNMGVSEIVLFYLPHPGGAIFNSYVPTPFPLRHTPSQEPIILYLQSNLHPSSRCTGHVFLYTHISP